RTTDWGDGKHHPEDYSSTNTGGEPLNSAGCLLSPNFHTEDQMGAAGTAFAISYESDIHKVTAENLVVFTVKYHTPWKRITTYEVPAGLPKCPKGISRSSLCSMTLIRSYQGGATVSGDGYLVNAVR
ncbi:hypothetical protein FRC18_008785, partial [Serendipita sp. 400]